MKTKSLAVILTLILCSVANIQAAQLPITVGTSGGKASLDTNFGNAQANFVEIYGWMNGMVEFSATSPLSYDPITGILSINLSSTAINTTGSVQGKVPFNSYATATTLTTATHNSSIVQMTVAGEMTLWDCEAANVGDTVMLWARDAEKIEVVPASGDHFVLFNGTTLTADYELDMAATAGTKVTLMCTADDTWSVYSETAPSTDGGAAD